MIYITYNHLQELNACQAGLDWFKNSKKRTLKTIVFSLLADNHFGYACWLVSHLLTRSQCIAWLIGSAKLSLRDVEDVFPDDKRPRLAIQVAEDFLAGKINDSAAAGKQLEKEIIASGLRLLGE